MTDQCAALTCPCGCGKVIRCWHVADCPDDCNIEANDEYRSTPAHRGNHQTARAENEERPVTERPDERNNRIYRVAVDLGRVTVAANEIYTEEGVRIWMAAKNRMLDGRSPEDLIQSGETQRVLDYIDYLAEGNFA